MAFVTLCFAVLGVTYWIYAPPTKELFFKVAWWIVVVYALLVLAIGWYFALDNHEPRQPSEPYKK
jgi:hypothetical protein